MREIKFEYGFECENEIIKKTYSLSSIPNIYNLCDCWNVFPIKYVRQYTGLKDKNGKEIYSDCEIFKFKFLKELHNPIDLIGSFSYNEEELRYEIDVYNNDEYTCLSYSGNGIMRDFEIIGNIYENPELLK